MIKEIKRIRVKYEIIRKQSEYVPVIQVINDLHQLEGEARIKRLPKNER